MRLTIRVQAAPFDVGAELAQLTAGEDGIGGIGCFVGQVRGGAELRALTLEHYPGMTERSLERIARAAAARWTLLACTIIHRVGRLQVGAPIVLVAVAAAHREPALAATGFLIDWLKTDAPFWKSEEAADGTVRWVDVRAHDLAQRDAWAGGQGATEAASQ